MFQGTFTALITPFRNGEIDTDAFRALIDRQVAAGVDGIVPCGTTGESPTLARIEHLRVIELAVQYAAGRIKVVAGTGANTIDTIARLAADCPTIIANKEAGGNPERVTQIKAALPDNFQVLSGDDPLTIEFMKRGAVGLVSVASNIIPDVMSKLVTAMTEGRTADAEAIQAEYEPLFKTLMSLDTNPVPIKTAVALQGRCTNELRLPLVNLTSENEISLTATLNDFGLIH